MTSPIDHLLAKARLRPAPYTQREIDAAEERIAARLTGQTPTHPTPTCPHTTPTAAATRCTRQTAARHLHTLCETVATHTGTPARLTDLLTRRIPQPTGAAVLGCLLHLAGRQDAARFWWQYAAGAEEPTALYCLYLHHHALGESTEANRWYHQADFTPLPTDEHTAEHELARALRILHALKRDQTLPRRISALIGYVPDAVDIIDDDFGIPVLQDGFADRIDALTTTAGRPRHHRRCTASPLPARKTTHPTPTAEDLNYAGHR